MQRSKLAEIASTGVEIDGQDDPLSFTEWSEMVDCTLKTIAQATERHA